MDDLHVRSSLGYGLIGFLLAIPVAFGNAVGFYLVLGTCRAENATRYPAACLHGDSEWEALAFGGVLAIALALPLLGLLGLRPSRLLGVALLDCAFWASYTFSVLAT